MYTYTHVHVHIHSFYQSTHTGTRDLTTHKIIDSKDVYICVFCTKEPLIIGLFCRKWPKSFCTTEPLIIGLFCRKWPKSSTRKTSISVCIYTHAHVHIHTSYKPTHTATRDLMTRKIAPPKGVYMYVHIYTYTYTHFKNPFIQPCGIRRRARKITITCVYMYVLIRSRRRPDL